MADTTTTTCMVCAAGCTRQAACSKRSAPSKEVPPNLKAISDLGEAEGTVWADGCGAQAPHGFLDIKCSSAFSGIMTAAPVIFRGSDSGGGLNKKPTTRFASAVGWNFF